MDNFVLPPKRGKFYLLNTYLDHTHDESSASQSYIIPWENSLIVVSKRNAKTAGCVGCVVRRLISTTYHRKEKICGIDSVWYGSQEIEKTPPFLDRNLENNETSSTKCYLYKFEQEDVKEIHILPVPACNCSRLPFPVLPPEFTEEWLQKWPNVILQRTSHASENLIRLHSAKLPNTAPLFVPGRTSVTCVPSSATVASLRDEAILPKRLVGESLERYALHLVPLGRLFINPENSSPLPSHSLHNIKPTLWTKVANAKNEEVFYPADEVFSGLHKLYSTLFRPLSSSGVAAHTNLESAKTHALLELLERDALLVAWRLADRMNLFYHLDSSLIKSREQQWIQRLVSKQGQELRVCAVANQFNLPVVLAIGLPLTHSNTFVPNFGSGAHFTWEGAYKKALKELLQGVALPDYEICDQIPTSFLERPRYWAHPSRLSILHRRLNPKAVSHISTAPSSLDDLVNKFDHFKLRLYFAELTTSDIALSNWRVVRAMCPDFEPFIGNSNYEKPNLRRINLFLDSKNERSTNKINCDPFPFP